jgi:hypothetical protein
MSSPRRKSSIFVLWIKPNQSAKGNNRRSTSDFAFPMKVPLSLEIQLMKVRCSGMTLIIVLSSLAHL